MSYREAGVLCAICKKNKAAPEQFTCSNPDCVALEVIASDLQYVARATGVVDKHAWRRAMRDCANAAYIKGRRSVLDESKVLGVAVTVSDEITELHPEATVRCVEDGLARQIGYCLLPHAERSTVSGERDRCQVHRATVRVLPAGLSTEVSDG